jgi:hypothetical protein
MDELDSYLNFILIKEDEQNKRYTKISQIKANLSYKFKNNNNTKLNIYLQQKYKAFKTLYQDEDQWVTTCVSINPEVLTSEYRKIRNKFKILEDPFQEIKEIKEKKEKKKDINLEDWFSTHLVKCDTSRIRRSLLYETFKIQKDTFRLPIKKEFLRFISEKIGEPKRKPEYHFMGYKLQKVT